MLDKVKSPISSARISLAPLGIVASLALASSSMGASTPPPPRSTIAKPTAVHEGAKKASDEPLPPFEVIQIAPSGWAGRFGMSNCGWLELEDGVLLVDTGGTKLDAENLLSQVKETTKGKAIRWVVLTHMHGHANSGLPAFLAGDPEILVSGSVATEIAEALASASPPGKKVRVTGVFELKAITSGSSRIEIHAAKGPAATGLDLWVEATNSGTVFVGDLVVPGRCPLLLNGDPDSWVSTLQEIATRKPSVLVGSEGDVAKRTEMELGITASYIERVVSVARAVRAQGATEARVTSELTVVQKAGDYCPSGFDVKNGLAIFQRVGPDGKVGPAPSAGPGPKR
jgi:glyoxylase-like metal-dependent hydrolase (beta-lactamase superfamily II)